MSGSSHYLSFAFSFSPTPPAWWPPHRSPIAPRCPCCFPGLQGHCPTHCWLTVHHPSFPTQASCPPRISADVSPWSCHCLLETLSTAPIHCHTCLLLLAIGCQYPAPCLGTKQVLRVGEMNERRISNSLLQTQMWCTQKQEKVASPMRYLSRNLHYAELTDKEYRDINLGLRNLHMHNRKVLFWEQSMSNTLLLPEDSEEMDFCIGWW